MNAPDLSSLDDIRREIDAIDDGILDLVARRLAAVERVRLVKEQAVTLTQSPIRPAREAFILRRLIARAEGKVPADLCLRLWRALIASATLTQAKIGIHMSSALVKSAGSRLLLGEYFGDTALVEHKDETAALRAIAGNGGDIAAVALAAPWIEPYRQGFAGSAQTICCLPFLTREPMPRILIFGHAPPEPTGADETLVVGDTELPASVNSRWRQKIESRFAAGLPGYLSGDDLPYPGLAVAGRYPSPLVAGS